MTAKPIDLAGRLALTIVEAATLVEEKSFSADLPSNRARRGPVAPERAKATAPGTWCWSRSNPRGLDAA